MAPERASGRVGECVRVQAARRRAGARSRVGRTEVGRVVAKAESTASRKTKTCPPPSGSSGDRVTIPSFVKTETTRTKPGTKSNQAVNQPTALQDGAHTPHTPADSDKFETGGHRSSLSLVSQCT